MELTNEEIARVFAMYFNPKEKMFINPDSGITYYGTLYQLSSMRGILYGYKLRLTPLSKISDEDAIEVAKIYTSCRHFTYKGKDEWGAHIMVNAEGVTFSLFSDLSGSYGDESIDYYKKDFVIIYLISKGYAVPLFFAPNHWANGKTAIELNIAIDKTLNQ